MSDQPKKQELPPLDATEQDSIAGQRAHRHSKYGFMGMIGCRERQLLAALSDNEAMQADNEAKDARIAELERWKREALAAMRENEEWRAKFNNYLESAYLIALRCKSAEAKLKSVEGIANDTYYADSGKARQMGARIREAVKGDK